MNRQNDMQRILTDAALYSGLRRRKLRTINGSSSGTLSTLGCTQAESPHNSIAALGTVAWSRRSRGGFLLVSTGHARDEHHAYAQRHARSASYVPHEPGGRLVVLGRGLSALPQSAALLCV